jgi:hypothetical protein
MKEAGEMCKLSSKKSSRSGILTMRALSAPSHATQFIASGDVSPARPKANQFTAHLIRRDIAARVSESINSGTANWPNGVSATTQVDRSLFGGGDGHLPNGAVGYAVRKNGTGCTASGAGTITGTVG